jgi:E3 ubiquitin-protein ligase HUWE1
MDPSSVAVSVDMTSHMTRAAPTAPPVSAYFLAEAVANVSRLVDSMLPTDECAETFVRRGGVALLIRLHAMPFLPDTFSTSSACHALSVTLRSFAGRSPYSPILASQTQDALTQCARLASAAVEDAIRLAVASDPGQPFLDVLDLVVAFRRDPSRVPGAKIEALLHEGLPRDGVANALRDVARALTVTQSVLNLTTSLLRSSPGTMPGLLNELGDGGEGAAAVKEWKPGGLIANVSYVYRNVEILAAILAEKEGERRDARARVANEIPRDAGSEGSDPEPIVAAVAAAMRAVESECARFRASFNAFASSLVKNVANARHRASAETVAFLRVPIAELSACLSVTVGDAADRVGGGPAPFRDGTDTGVLSPGIARRRLCGLFETLHAILIDERRRCSQGLVINYMDRCLGVERAREAFEALWRVAEHEAGVFVEKAQKLDERESSVEAKGKAPRRQTNVASSSRKPSVDLSMTTTKILPAHVAAALRSATSLLLQLVDVDVLFGSSGSAANVVAPAGFVPTTDAKGLGTPSYPPPSDPRVFAARLHANLAPAVLAAWRSKALSFFPGEAASHLMSALVHLGKGTEKLPERVAHYLERERHERERSAGGGSRSARPGAGLPDAAEAARRFLQSTGREVRGGAAGSGVARPARPPPPPFTPSPSMTASIMEMGFSEAQARAALVAVRGRSIELAMDWLFSHPNEARIADEEAAACRCRAAAGGGGGAGDADTGGGAAAAVDGSGAAVDAAVAAVDVAATPAATTAVGDDGGGARVARGSRDAPRRGRGRRAHARAPDVHARRGGGGR